MKDRQRRLLFLFALVVSLTFLAAPARGSGLFSLQISSHGAGLSVGVSDWWAYGSAWHDGGWTASYDATLAGYGEWVHVAGLGRSWRPFVAATWRPFTFGRWVVTSLGWTWISYEPWGYFPHHYGRWAFTIHGWVWVPGYTYQPANVVWVRWGGYVGWYPCPPLGWSHAARGYRHGYRNGFQRGYGRGYDYGWRDAQHATYVGWSHLDSHDISRHSLSPPAIRTRAGSLKPTATTNAPTTSDVRRRGGSMVPNVAIEQRQLTVDGRRLTVSRPAGMESDVERHARRAVHARARATNPRASTPPKRPPKGVESPRPNLRQAGPRHREDTSRSRELHRQKKPQTGSARRR